MARKLFTNILLAFVLIFYQALFGITSEIVSDIKSDWYTYSGNPYYFLGLPGERSMYFNVEDFGLDYPVTLLSLQTFIYEAGAGYKYRVYKGDGISMIWESSDSTSVYNSWQSTELDTVLTLTDDFWISFVPLENGAPRTCMDSGEGLSSNSFIGSPGEWNSLSDIYGKPLNHSMKILLEPYSGVDIYPPTIKNISGTECFMDQEANICIEVQEQNSIISPITGKYSINEGNTWHTFLLSMNKNNGFFSGIVPSQTDGTQGLLKFILEDDQGNSGISQIFEIEWSKDNFIFEEKFEMDIFPPPDWELVSTGTGWFHNLQDSLNNYVNSGEGSAGHKAYPEYQDDWIISPSILIPNTGCSTLFFYQAGELLENLSYHEVSISRDNGITWEQLYCDDQPAPNCDISESFEKKYLSLNSYRGDSIRIGWHYKGQNSDNWYIDDISVFYDEIAPQIENIAANPALLPIVGAYLNNNMVIKLTVVDNFGVESVKATYTFNNGSTYHQTGFFPLDDYDNVWSGTILASDIELQGQISFEIYDISGNINNTEQYEIKFVKDTDGPVIKKIDGLRTYVFEFLRFEVSIDDESELGYCTGSYSKDNWVTQFDVQLFPSKVHEHVYTGRLLPEAEEIVNGKLKLTLRDIEGNLTESDEFIVKWTYPYESAFDLRTSLGDNYVTSVKSQLGGTCWTFASVSSMESNLLMSGIWEAAGESGAPDLAEYHLDWWNGFNQNNNDDVIPATGTGLVVHQGGDYLISAAYMSRCEGFVRNIDGQLYDTPPLRNSQNFHYFYPRDIEWYTTDDTFRSLDLIKEKVKQHGAVGTCIRYSPAYLNNNIHYQPETSDGDPNHAVTIVGWDDNIYTGAFEGRGAWLIKNSWGVSWGISGYFWVSYYDKHCTKNAEMGAVSFYNVEPMKYDNVYYHDYHGWRDTMTYVDEAFNAFTTVKDEDLVAVSFYTAMDNVNYTINVYDDFDGYDLDNLLSTASGYIEYKGFHTVELPSVVYLSAANDFYVYISLSQGGHAIDRTSYISVLLGGGSKTTVISSASAGESYYRNNKIWYDLYNNQTIEYPGTANFCIKALCDDESSIDDGEWKIENYELEQNYPNPFNPTTTINFLVPND
ncbi:MAG: choice-of-anchor J domain-containing protein, partial [Candidatus Delongbacteria bacterium]|nr:choice-of-anchor J domain-containing protein [Candidatus Delongbacteria bacterium]